VQQAKSACKRKGLFKDYDDALEALADSDEQAKSLRRAIANAKKKGADEPDQSQEALKSDLKAALLKKKEAEGDLAEAAEGFFSLAIKFTVTCVTKVTLLGMPDPRPDMKCVQYLP
jgi:hypothetical protein